MSTMFLMGVLTFACAFAAMHQQSPTTLTMEVYYASVGRDNEEFITRQLYPTYVAINKGYLPLHPPLQVELIPYGDCVGRSTPVGARRTCALNKVHACAIALSRNENNWTPLNYINCLMTTRGDDDPPSCAVRTCFDDRLMASCVNTVDGDRLLAAHRGRNNFTAELPYVTFQGVYDESDQYRARTNLLSLVCDKMKPTELSVCRTPRAIETMTHDNYGSGYYYPERIHCYFWTNNWHW